MPLNLPENRQVVDSRTKADLQSELQEQNPYLRASFLAALASATAGRNYEFYIQLQNAIDECFADTADDVFLQRWGSFRGATQNPATQSIGFITVTGVNGTIIPADTLLVTNSGTQISTQNEVSIADQTVGISTLIRTGFTVTATISGNHNLATGVSVTISGANESEYNGTFSVIVTGENTFTYEIVGSPISPATGSPVFDASYVAVNTRSVDFGFNTNLSSGTLLNFVTPIAGADSPAAVQFDGLTGGSDIESLESFRGRVLFAYQNPNTPFNVAEITRLAKTVTGVTRVFVQEVTPSLGQVTVYFVRDNDTNIFPSPGEIAEVKDLLLTIKPAHTSDDNLIVTSPAPLTVNFQFLSISPNTQTMRDSIVASLQAFFEEEVVLGQNIDEDVYRSVIFQVIDIETGQRLNSYDLASPTGDIPVAINELPVLGTVVF